MAEAVGQSDGVKRRSGMIWREIVLPALYVGAPVVATFAAVFWYSYSQNYISAFLMMILFGGFFFVSLGKLFAYNSVKRSRIARGATGEWPGNRGSSAFWFGWIKQGIYANLLLTPLLVGLIALIHFITTDRLPISPFLGLGALGAIVWFIASLVVISRIGAKDEHAMHRDERHPSPRRLDHGLEELSKE